jgi:hypothetical protein
MFSLDHTDSFASFCCFVVPVVRIGSDRKSAACDHSRIVIDDFSDGFDPDSCLFHLVAKMWMKF